jgi:hypothetical protein
MPMLFYLPLILWTGLIEIVLTAHELDDGNAAQPMSDPADLMIQEGVIRFPLPQ